MANDFSQDSNCKALWNFESGAVPFLADSKGTNTILHNYGVAEDTNNYKQGSCSAFFVKAESDRMLLQDTELDAGFPLRSDAEHTTFSFAFWIRLTAIDTVHNFLTKGTGGAVECVKISVDSSNHMDLAVSANGSAYSHYVHASVLADAIWYHCVVTHNDADDAYRIRIWDDDAQEILGSDKTGNTVTPFLGDGNFILGYANTTTLDGNLDEFISFDDVLTVDEIDQISAGTYGGAPPSQTVLDYERKTRGVARGVCRGAA